MNPHDLALALANQLTGLKPTVAVGVGDLPSEDPELPYAIVYPLGAVDFRGSYNTPEDTGMIMLQVTCVGDTIEQVAWLQEFVRDTITARSGSTWVHSLAVDGSEPEGRFIEELGSITDSGQELRQSADTYRFRGRFA